MSGPASWTEAEAYEAGFLACVGRQDEGKHDGLSAFSLCLPLVLGYPDNQHLRQAYARGWKEARKR